MSEQALVSVGADLSALRRELGNIPNMSAKEMQRLLISVERTAQKAEKAAKAAVKNTARESAKAAKEAEKAQEDLNKSTKEGAKGLAEFLGFDVGPLEKLGEASKLANTGIGAVALGSAAAVAALAGMAAGIYAAVTSAIELRGGLEELAAASVIPPLDPAFSTSLGQAEDTMAALSVATDVLVYELGGSLAPVVTGVVVGLIDLIAWSKEVMVSFGGISGIIKTLLAIQLQNMIDVITLGATAFARFVGVVGKVASALGADGVGFALQEASTSFLDFKNSLGEKVATAFIDNTISGINGITVGIVESASKYDGFADKVEKAHEKGEKGARAHKDQVKDLAKEAADASEKLKDMALSMELDELKKLTGEYEKQKEVIAELAKKSGDASAATAASAALDAKYLKDKNDILKSQAEEAQKAADEARALQKQTEEAVAVLESMDGIYSKIAGASLKKVAEGVRSIGSALVEASGAGDILSALTDPAALLALTADAASSGNVDKFIKDLVNGASSFIKAIVDALPEVLDALVELLPGLIENIVEAIPQIVEAISGALPKIVEILAEAIPSLIAAVIDSIPAIIEGLILSIPALITGLIKGLPILIESLISLGPKLIGSLVKTLIKLLFTSVPDMVKAIFQALRGAFIKVKNVLKDLFKEAITFGRAKTDTFGDTPGPVKTGAEGLRAMFSPGDIVLAAKTPEGLASQVSTITEKAAPQQVTAKLDLRDGLVFIDKALKQNIARGGNASTINRTYGRRR
jgi:phage-related protein